MRPAVGIWRSAGGFDPRQFSPEGFDAALMVELAVEVASAGRAPIREEGANKLGLFLFDFAIRGAW